MDARIPLFCITNYSSEEEKKDVKNAIEESYTKRNLTKYFEWTDYMPEADGIICLKFACILQCPKKCTSHYTTLKKDVIKTCIYPLMILVHKNASKITESLFNRIDKKHNILASLLN
uniref:Uncharacterized protein n=1 Tax=Panagrolaimus sp. ES5 TaxID=591445 RepID=A0AC34EZW4_9BILA